jgi:hypothetical protein
MRYIAWVWDRVPHDRSQLGRAYFPMALDLEPPLAFTAVKIFGRQSDTLDALDVASAIGAEASDGFEADPVDLHPMSELSGEVLELAVVQVIE